MVVFSRTCERQISGNSASQIKQLNTAWFFWSEQLSWSSLIRNNKQNEISLHEIAWNNRRTTPVTRFNPHGPGWLRLGLHNIKRYERHRSHTWWCLQNTRSIWLAQLKRPNLFCQEALNYNLHLNGILWQQNLKVLSLETINIICHFIILFLTDYEPRLQFEQEQIVLVYVNRWSDSHPHVLNYIKTGMCQFWIMLSINSMVGLYREISS